MYFRPRISRKSKTGNVWDYFTFDAFYISYLFTKKIHYLKYVTNIFSGTEKTANKHFKKKKTNKNQVSKQ